MPRRSPPRPPPCSTPPARSRTSSGPSAGASPDCDEADLALDATVRLIRGQLAGRSPSARREAPYTDVFPKGIDYYVRARLVDQRVRYEQLVQRIEACVPESDPIRALVPVVQQQLNDWLVAESEVGDARNALELARTRRDKRVAAWKEEIERAYGLLVSRVGRIRAEQFFPQRFRKARPADADPAPTGTDAAEGAHAAAPEVPHDGAPAPQTDAAA